MKNIGTYKLLAWASLWAADNMGLSGLFLGCRVLIARVPRIHLAFCDMIIIIIIIIISSSSSSSSSSIMLLKLV